MAVDNEQTLTINQPLALAINWSNKTSSCYLADWTDEEPFNPVQLSCKDDIVFSSNKYEGCTDEPHTVISATSRCSRNTKKRVRFADECQDVNSAATTHDDDNSTDATENKQTDQTQKHPTSVVDEHKTLAQDEIDSYVSHNLQDEIKHKYSKEEWREMLLQGPNAGPIFKYLEQGSLVEDEKKAQTTVYESSQYEIVDGLLYHIRRKTKRRRGQIAYRVLQLVVPKKVQQQIINLFHVALCHARLDRTYLTMAASVFWKNMYQMTRMTISQCRECLLADKTRPARIKLEHKVPSLPGECLYIDVLSLAPCIDPATGLMSSYALLIVDECTDYLTALPMHSLTAQETSALMERYIGAHTLVGHPEWMIDAHYAHRSHSE
jgi:hypothetical protein